ncbi:hypothetical protein [Halomonas marinisediminis]|uniref:Transmembrane protein n=1 Tax=Halomonas marinisediminis TaxID=2546095 RepID=A0ABY2DBM6_9GAMM|nr:hypothetical protein [Halomonas marinisediminis]TDB05578.1 hypothetical protein E0702_01020 [Halomonas marinisediminis]
MGGQPTAERLSLLLGLALLMLASLPRYLVAGHENRFNLMLMALAVVCLVGVLQWRLLDVAGKARLPRLLSRLGLCLLAGLAGMAGWHALFTDFIGWELWLSHGTTLGLLLHALGLWVRPPFRE